MTKAIRWSPEQLAAHQAKQGHVARRDLKDGIKPQPTGQQRMQALGRLRDGQMNKTEARYAAYLDSEKAAGRVAWWKFESIKLRLAERTFYVPDFFVMKSNGELEVHEVKGFMLDDANVKIKVASDGYPFRFIIVKANKFGGFDFKEVGNARNNKEGPE